MGRHRKEISKTRQELEERFFFGESLLESLSPGAMMMLPRTGQTVGHRCHVQTPAAFDVAGRRDWIFDPFHLPGQMAKLQNDGTFPTRRSVQELISFMQVLDGRGGVGRTELVLEEFASPEFRQQLRQVDQQRREAEKQERLLGKMSSRRLQKIALMERLMPAYKAIVSKPFLSKSSLSRLLKVPRSFLDSLEQFSRDPIPFLEQRASLLDQLEDRKLDNDMFLWLLQEEQLTLRTRSLLMSAFNELDPCQSVQSLSTFDRRFLASNKITRQRVKIEWDQQRQEERTACRLSFIERLLEARSASHSLYFFDETSFQLDASVGHAYGMAGRRPIAKKKHVPAFLHVLMVTSLNGVMAFQVSSRPTTASTIERFITNFVTFLQHRSDHQRTPAILVLDNAPKNRTDGVRLLEDTRQINLLYTVPCSPFLNQIESVFNLLKRRVRGRPDFFSW